MVTTAVPVTTVPPVMRATGFRVAAAAPAQAEVDPLRPHDEVAGVEGEVIAQRDRQGRQRATSSPTDPVQSGSAGRVASSSSVRSSTASRASVAISVPILAAAPSSRCVSPEVPARDQDQQIDTAGGVRGDRNAPRVGRRTGSRHRRRRTRADQHEQLAQQLRPGAGHGQHACLVAAQLPQRVYQQFRRIWELRRPTGGRCSQAQERRQRAGLRRTVEQVGELLQEVGQRVRRRGRRRPHHRIGIGQVQGLEGRRVQHDVARGEDRDQRPVAADCDPDVQRPDPQCMAVMVRRVHQRARGPGHPHGRPQIGQPRDLRRRAQADAQQLGLGDQISVWRCRRVPGPAAQPNADPRRTAGGIGIAGDGQADGGRRGGDEAQLARGRHGGSHQPGQLAEPGVARTRVHDDLPQPSLERRLRVAAGQVGQRQARDGTGRADPQHREQVGRVPGHRRRATAARRGAAGPLRRRTW